MISDNLAGAFDMAGSNPWIDGNTLNTAGPVPGEKSRRS